MSRYSCLGHLNYPAAVNVEENRIMRSRENCPLCPSGTSRVQTFVFALPLGRETFWKVLRIKKHTGVILRKKTCFEPVFLFHP